MHRVKEKGGHSDGWAAELQPLALPFQVWLRASLCRLLTGTLMHRKQRPSLLKLLWASEQTASPLPHRSSASQKPQSSQQSLHLGGQTA